MNTLVDSIKKLNQPLEPVPTGTPLKLDVIDGMKTILFDIYGTLIISGSGDVGPAAAQDSSEALIQALIVAGYQGEHERAGELGREMLHAQIEHWHKTEHENGTTYPEIEISIVWKKIIEQFQHLEILRPDDDPQKILRLAVEYENRINPVWPMPGALETIDALRERGFRLGIVSNAQFYTPLMFEALLGKSLEDLGFDPDLMIFSYKKLKAKPAVELFQALTDKTNLSESLYVGNDMLNDIWTASETGCKTCLFAGDQRSLRLREDRKECKNLQPDAVIDQLSQLTEIV